MESTDFPSWFGASLYGGLGCAVLAALAIAVWSLARRRGLSTQVLMALLICLIASALDAGPIVWLQNRLGVYGPTLATGEVAAALIYTALVGWMAPLGAMVWYLLYAAPLDAPTVTIERTRPSPTPELSDPGRRRAALPDGRAWGVLAPESGDQLSAIPLRAEVVLIGRDPAADLMLMDERVSRIHAELRWGGGQVTVTDLSSMNGTRVNSITTSGQAPVRDGDLLEFGDSRFHYNQNEAPAASPLPDATAETRKTAGVSGTFGAGGRPLALVWERNDEPPQRWPLDAAITSIGRDAGCNVALSDDSVSRIHAQITRQPSGYYIVDVESSNGVLVNDAPVTGPQRLTVGDRLQLGDVRLSVADAFAQGSADAATVTSE